LQDHVGSAVYDVDDALYPGVLDVLSTQGFNRLGDILKAFLPLAGSDNNLFDSLGAAALIAAGRLCSGRFCRGTGEIGGREG
jgi:hypothetical protein